MHSTLPQISLIAAMAENRVIGRANQLPWHLPADLRHFKQLTMGKPMIMGRRTWQSLPGLLPGRRHIVVSSNPTLTAEGCELADNLAGALKMAGTESEVMVIGGAALYRQTLPLASCLYLTLIHAEFEGDIRFPDFEPVDWIEVSREEHAADVNNAYDYTFLALTRVNR